jgi:hypothetical protein
MLDRPMASPLQEESLCITAPWNWIWLPLARTGGDSTSIKNGIYYPITLRFDSIYVMPEVLYCLNKTEQTYSSVRKKQRSKGDWEKRKGHKVDQHQHDTICESKRGTMNALARGKLRDAKLKLVPLPLHHRIF